MGTKPVGNPPLCWGGKGPTPCSSKGAEMDVIRESDLFDYQYYSDGPGRDGAAPENDLLFHYASEGEAAGQRPNPLFDPAYYATQLDFQANAECLLVHYILEGWRQGLRTHPLF